MYGSLHSEQLMVSPGISMDSGWKHSVFLPSQTSHYFDRNKIKRDRERKGKGIEYENILSYEFIERR